MKRWFLDTGSLWSAALLLAGLAATGGAARESHASGLLIADGGLGGVLQIERHEVSVVINNGIAVTQVHQVFRNTEQRVVEALYTFPVPAGASVSNFKMLIGGKEMTGEVVEKKRAREIYNSYKAVKRDPGLLEQTDFRTFELRIFPIAAGAEQEIWLTWHQQLDFDHDTATWVYPLATTTRPDIDTKVHGRFSMTVDVKSEIPITKLFSTSHEDEFVIASHAPGYVRASLETEGGNLARDVVLGFDVERPRTGIDVITSRQSGEDGYFLLTMTAGAELEEASTAMDYVFVVDISGSMASQGKLIQSRSTVESFLDALGPEDRFEVLTFSSVPDLHFGELKPADNAARESAREYLASQHARGGTVLRPALQTAYKFRDTDRPLNVVLLSDGMTEASEQSELVRLIEEAEDGIRVFCVGIGNEVNRPLLKQLAEGAGGLAAFVSQEDDFSRQAQLFRRKLMRAAATDLKIELDGAEAYDVTPQVLPDLFHGAPLRMYGRYRKPGPVTVKVSATVLGQPQSQSVQLMLPENNDDNPEIERMWAYEQVQQKQAEIRRSGETPQLAADIISLCEGYSIVSEYASFLVLENDAEYQRWSIARRNATRVQRDDSARAKLTEQLQTLRDAALSKVGPAGNARPTGLPHEAAGTPVDAATTPANAGQPLPGDLNWGQTPINAAVPNSNPVRNQPDPVIEQNWSNRNGNAGSSMGGGGGGAIDPLSGLAALGLAAAAFAARRRQPASQNT
ncbi:MAG: VIT and vWA domain-containing protein [Planctomycetaceae bacterium]